MYYFFLVDCHMSVLLYPHWLLKPLFPLNQIENNSLIINNSFFKISENFYLLTHPILAKTKNQILLFFFFFFYFSWIHVNSQKKYPQRKNFKENPNILEFKEVDHKTKHTQFVLFSSLFFLKRVFFLILSLFITYRKRKKNPPLIYLAKKKSPSDFPTKKKKEKNIWLLVLFTAISGRQ